MRVLNATTKRLQNLAEDAEYAILSHTWGADKEEILYEDLHNKTKPLPSHKGAWKKLEYTCGQALKDGLSYVWIDTCCIDKSSSAELTEAINSMFVWYLGAKVCYAYLADVYISNPTSYAVDDAAMSTLQEHQFRQSRYFTRGWTLQELIAPSELRFFDRFWQYIGHREQGTAKSLHNLVAEITNVPVEVLSWHIPRAKSYTGLKGRRQEHIQPVLRQILSSYCVAERMSWARGRKTKRPEDIAYSLLGLFDVQMTQMYGEGEKAFLRLQEEIINHHEDQSILAWCMQPHLQACSSALAPSPEYFASMQLVHPPVEPIGIMSASPKVINFKVAIAEFQSEGTLAYAAMLECAFAVDLASRPIILLAELRARSAKPSADRPVSKTLSSTQGLIAMKRIHPEVLGRVTLSQLTEGTLSITGCNFLIETLHNVDIALAVAPEQYSSDKSFAVAYSTKGINYHSPAMELRFDQVPQAHATVRMRETDPRPYTFYIPASVAVEAWTPSVPSAVNHVPTAMVANPLYPRGSSSRNLVLFICGMMHFRPAFEQNAGGINLPPKDARMGPFTAATSRFIMWGFLGKTAFCFRRLLQGDAQEGRDYFVRFCEWGDVIKEDVPAGRVESEQVIRESMETYSRQVTMSPASELPWLDPYNTYLAQRTTNPDDTNPLLFDVCAAKRHSIMMTVRQLLGQTYLLLEIKNVSRAARTSRLWTRN